MRAYYHSERTDSHVSLVYLYTRSSRTFLLHLWYKLSMLLSHCKMSARYTPELDFHLVFLALFNWSGYLYQSISLPLKLLMLTYKWFPVKPLHPIKPLAMWLVLAVILFPLLPEEGVADAATSHGALLVTFRAVAIGWSVGAEEREVWFIALCIKSLC